MSEAASHSPTSPSLSSTNLIKDRRFKLSRACDRCRRRRIRCDEGHPCKSCVSASSDCTFEEMGKKSAPHKSKRSTLEDRMQHLETIIQALPSGFFAAAGIPGGDPNNLRMPGLPIGSPQILGVPPPSLTNRTLTNPSRHFPQSPHSNPTPPGAIDSGSELSSLPLASSYLYFDDQGSTRWQGEMSGFPLLDLLLEREASNGSSGKRSESPEGVGNRRNRSPIAHIHLNGHEDESCSPASAGGSSNGLEDQWFPDRERTSITAHPEAIWAMVAAGIAPDLMDSLVKCFLSTTYYLMPFIHVPSFLSDYADPVKWDPGFASFIIAICCLTSRHVDDVRVRKDPTDAFSAGQHWFELFFKLRQLPGADRPTLYNVQSVLVVAVYAIGLGRLSKGLALLSEAITLCIDAGLHRSVAAYDYFDCIETEVRKRTFWSVYAWDKQAAAYFGRPPMIRLRDCDVPEPELVDDDYITKDSVGLQPPGITPLMSAFVSSNRLYVIIEAVLDVHPMVDPSHPSTSFMARATSALSGFRQSKDLREAEALLDEWCMSLPPQWAVTAETMASKDVVRITQAERLHCLEHFIRMLIYRYRFSLCMAHPGPGSEEAKLIAMKMSQRSAMQIIAKHLEISSLGLMTYYGLFVIHQLTQAGRTLIAVLLECNNDDSLAASSLEALKACVGLLRRFSGRYVCGLRSADLLEEICRLSSIPLEILEQQTFTSMRPPWLRPVRKRFSSRSGQSEVGSPAPMSSSENVIMQDMYNAIPQHQSGQLSASHAMSGPFSMCIPHQSQLPASPLNGKGSLTSQMSLSSNPHALNPQFMAMPTGAIEPLTADLFATQDDISGFSADDLLALLGGGTAGNGQNVGFSTSLLQPPSPLSPSSVSSRSHISNAFNPMDLGLGNNVVSRDHIPWAVGS